MKKICLLFIMLYGLSAKAQPFSMDTLLVSDMKYDFICISVFDSIYVLQKYNYNRQGRDNTYIIKPSSVDTLNLRTSQMPIHFGGYLFFDYNYNNKSVPVWSYSSGLQYLSLNEPIFSDLGSEYVVIVPGSNEDEYRIEFINPITKEIVPFIKFKDLALPPKPVFESGWSWGFNRPLIIDDEKAIIEIGYSDVSGYTYFYFKEKNDIKQITELLEGATSISENTIMSIDRKSIVFRMEHREGISSRIFYKLFSSSIEPIGEILLRDTPSGLNMQNGKFSGYFLTAHLDNLYSAVFYYELNPTLELAMYKAFHDGFLSQQDINGLTKKDLGILRNLLFAKHNYQFDSLYYQAYFKTLEFYQRLDKKSRTKNISHLLTNADKANIALIRAAEAEVKE